MEVSGHLHAPDTSRPGEEYPVLIEQTAEWVSEAVWTGETTGKT